MRDQYLKGEISRVHAENLSVYGADKVWGELNREGIRVARCTDERLMRELGLPALGVGAPSRSPRDPTSDSTVPTTSSAASSRRRPPTACGWPT
jgi:putative transposase